METTSKNGIQYIIKKREFENKELFYDKCWNITNKEPKTQNEFQKIHKICQLTQNEIELKCKYTNNK